MIPTVVQFSNSVSFRYRRVHLLLKIEKTETMNILITAAEQEELNCAIKAHEELKEQLAGKAKIDFTLTGIGSTQACHTVTREIYRGMLRNEPYSLVVNIGIAGSYDMEAFPMGSAAIVEKEYFGDLGFDTNDGFKDLFQYGILKDDGFPYKGGALVRIPSQHKELEALLAKYGKGTGITVQTVTGNSSTVERLRNKYAPHVESMEGAAVYFACIHENTPCFGLRTVSNAVGERNMKKWNIPAALDTLYRCCHEIFASLAK